MQPGTPAPSKVTWSLPPPARPCSCVTPRSLRAASSVSRMLLSAGRPNQPRPATMPVPVSWTGAARQAVQQLVMLMGERGGRQAVCGADAVLAGPAAAREQQPEVLAGIAQHDAHAFLAQQFIADLLEGDDLFGRFLPFFPEPED